MTDRPQMLGDPDDAKDTSQEVLVRMVTKRTAAEVFRRLPVHGAPDDFHRTRPSGMSASRASNGRRRYRSRLEAHLTKRLLQI